MLETQVCKMPGISHPIVLGGAGEVTVCVPWSGASAPPAVVR